MRDIPAWAACIKARGRKPPSLLGYGRRARGPEARGLRAHGLQMRGLQVQAREVSSSYA